MIAKFDKTTRDGNGTGLREYLENGTHNDRDLKDKRATGTVVLTPWSHNLPDRGYKNIP